MNRSRFVVTSIVAFSRGADTRVLDNSFQVTSIGGKAVKPLLVADTILIPFKEFTGKTVYHCHILPHEDTGMMKNILMV